MSLYEDLDVTPGGSGGVGSSGAASGWSLPMQKTLLLQQQRRLQQQQQAAAAAAAASSGSGGGGGGHHQRSGSGGSAGSAAQTLAPVLNLKGKRDTRTSPIVGNLGAGVGGGEYRFNQRTGRMERSTAPVGAKSGVNDPTLSLGPDDEYNPFYPNEYEEVVGMIRAKRKMLELAESDKQPKQSKSQQKHQQHHQKKSSSSSSSSSSSTTATRPVGKTEASSGGRDSDGSFHSDGGSSDREDSDHEEEDKKRRMGRGAYIAPPTSLLVQDAKPIDPPPSSNSQGGGPGSYPPVSGKPTLAEKHNVSTAAANMMAKMGYRHGQGLGREGQGMASALSVEKTSKRGGKIVSELDKYRNPSLVIMLTNMVGPGEVDDELEHEIKDECQKYGPVVLVTIFELPRPNIPAEEAVRIFVEFERLDSAIKAMNELNGRFFGGRTVTCRFYDAERFRDLELEGQPLPLELNE